MRSFHWSCSFMFNPSSSFAWMCLAKCAWPYCTYLLQYYPGEVLSYAVACNIKVASVNIQMQFVNNAKLLRYYYVHLCGMWVVWLRGSCEGHLQCWKICHLWRTFMSLVGCSSVVYSSVMLLVDVKNVWFAWVIIMWFWVFQNLTFMKNIDMSLVRCSSVVCFIGHVVEGSVDGI